MYCVKCGVELADSEKKCPLCMTPVYYPNLPEKADTPYPKHLKPKDELGTRGMYFVITFLLAIGIIIPAMCDISLHRGVTFSGYVAGGIILFYVMLIMPGWFRHPSPAVFVPVDFAVTGIFLAYVNYQTGGNWFFGFALPILGGFALIICSVFILIYYLRTGYLYIFGGALIATGFLSLLIEFLLYRNFVYQAKTYWSMYPFVALLLLGLMLIIIAIVTPLRESLRKIFAI